MYKFCFLNIYFQSLQHMYLIILMVEHLKSPFQLHIDLPVKNTGEVYFIELNENLQVLWTVFTKDEYITYTPTSTIDYWLIHLEECPLIWKKYPSCWILFFELIFLKPVNRVFYLVKVAASSSIYHSYTN